MWREYEPCKTVFAVAHIPRPLISPQGVLGHLSLRWRVAKAVAEWQGGTGLQASYQGSPRSLHAGGGLWSGFTSRDAAGELVEAPSLQLGLTGSRLRPHRAAKTRNRGEEKVRLAGTLGTAAPRCRLATQPPAAHSRRCTVIELNEAFELLLSWRAISIPAASRIVRSGLVGAIKKGRAITAFVSLRRHNNLSLPLPHLLPWPPYSSTGPRRISIRQWLRIPRLRRFGDPGALLAVIPADLPFNAITIISRCQGRVVVASIPQQAEASSTVLVRRIHRL